tara:strand:+ start:226 stop:750 length:525 start_codon:yes stop_codon:yes gene_type:complete
MAEEDKLKGKPRTVGAAVKKNEKFFYDKKGVKKLAVTAETLKKEGKTLRQWANDFGKSSEKKTTPKKTMRPRARNQVSDRVGAIIKTEPITVTRLSVDASTARKKGFKKKTPTKTVPKKDLKGAAWMKANTYAAYEALSKSEARALGLPATRVMSTQHPLRNQKFKDGKNFMGK